MPKGIDDLIRQRIKKDLAGKNGTKQQIADRHNVSIGTVKRLAKEIKPVTTVVEASTAAIARSVVAGGAVEDLDYGTMLKTLIKGLETAFEKAEPKSKEGVAGRLIEAMDKYREMMTMRQAIRWVINLPDFDPAEFTRILKEEYADSQRAG